MDRRTARSLDTDLNSSCSLSKLSPSHPKVLRYCSSVQFLARDIREASVMLVSETINSCNPVQLSEMEMILSSVI
jgi:hypothetical protein